MRRSRNPRAFAAPKLQGNCDSCKYFATIRKAAYCTKKDARLMSMEPCESFVLADYAIKQGDAK